MKKEVKIRVKNERKMKGNKEGKKLWKEQLVLENKGETSKYKQKGKSSKREVEIKKPTRENK